MAAVETYPERYANPADFAREVNLPLLGTARVRPVPAASGLAQLLEASSGSEALAPVVESLTETRRSLTLRSLLVAGFPHDPECFATGLCLAREWSRRGLRVALIDLDFWNPTVLRPPSHPNEGLVDVLEYGCSFGRVAWEIVADRLWLIGPGSHPPDEARIAEHPDWAREARVFAACVDVAVYVAPLLDRRGFTGKLSKKVDAVVLAASTERVARTDLRDAFLELWSSDAPMIGCVGIDPTDARPVSEPPAWEREAAVGVYAAEVARVANPAERGVAERGVTERGVPERESASMGARFEPVTPQAMETPARGASTPGRTAATPGRTVATPAAAVATPAAAASSAASGSRSTSSRSARQEDAGAEREIEQALERDVRRGIVEKKAARGSSLWAIAGAVVAVALVAGGLSAMLARRSAPPRGSVQATQPAGEEPIAPTPPTEEAGNLDTPSVTEPGRPGEGEIGAVTAMGKEIQSASPGASPTAPSASIGRSQSATPPASPTGGSNALNAGLTGGVGVMPPAGAATSGAKPFRVHVASFRTEWKVRELVQGLRAKKLDAYFEPPPPGGDWYRVFVGHFATEAEAATYGQWLLKSGAVDRAQSYPQTKR